MGIDIYAKWYGMTEAEEAAQITGFSVEHGHVGYLREAYHGEPYATRCLVEEAFLPANYGKAHIGADLLEARLPETLELAEKRERELYHSPDDQVARVLQSYRDFVALCVRKERETGDSCLIIASY